VLILLLITPAFVAGAITDEKRRGTLQYLLLTDLEARHIILGKLMGRFAQVILVLLGGLPLFALLAGFGGVEPISLLFLLVGLILPVFGLCSVTLLASVWCRQTRDAVLGLYVVVVLAGLVVLLVGGPLRYLDPIFVLQPAWGPAGSHDLAEAGRRLAFGSIAWGIVGMVGIGLAIARLRPVHVRELESVRQTATHWFAAEREPIDEEPVHWRERHVEGLAPNASFRRVPQWLAITLIASATTLSSLAILYFSLAPGVTVSDVVRSLLNLNVRKVAESLHEASTLFLLQSIVVMLLASLVVGIRCSGAVTAERERQTWEALLLTPLSAKSIIRGKMWGIMGASYWYLLAYAAPAVALSALGGPLALAYTVLWLGAAILAMYFIGAAGLWCSVRATDSWRSLLHTMAVGYVGGLSIYAVTSPIIFILAGILLLMIAFIDLFLQTGVAMMCLRNGAYFFRVFSITSSIALALIFWLLAKMFLARAQRWVADRDRTRHWYDEPYYRRSRDPGSLSEV
jgi:ABC-type transport system involved in multi-copper enzyme maturation permease subunit